MRPGSSDEYAAPQEEDLLFEEKNQSYQYEVTDKNREQWRDRFAKPFTKAERSNTTIWMTGLTRSHDVFVCAAARRLGYNMETLPIPDNQTLTIGKEYGNRGQCNPTYYTVGNLVRKLHGLELEGHGREDLVKDFLFFTAGSCGPCRFGMYATEYRKALREAGYEGFRIEQLVQNDVVDGEKRDDRGMEFDLAFIKAIVKAFLAGDMLNLLGHRIRPYEIEKGTTNKVLEECRAIVAEALENGKAVRPALRKCRALMRSIEVDRLQPKPMVSVIGEIWAMTTEGEGNYNIHSFLEEEGAEVSVQPMFNWLLYLLWEQRRDLQIRMKLRGEDLANRGLVGKNPRKRMVMAILIEKLIRASIHSFARAAGLSHVHLPDIARMAEASHEHYDIEIRGGETFMEVGKFIDIANSRRAHLVISVKPFGCMPSSGVSDGIQSLTTARYPDTAFYSIETTGDGKASVHSRIQMMMFKAHQRAKAEFEDALATGNMTFDEAKQKLQLNPRCGSALHYPKHGVATTAANFASELSRLS